MCPFDSPQTTRESTNTSQSGGDVLLKWGHRKRSRLSRAAIEDSSSSVHTNNNNNNNSNNMRRVITHTVPPNFSMPPPPPLVSSTASSARVRNHCHSHSPRNLEDPSLGGSESPSRNSQGSNPVVCRSAAPKVSSSGMERSSRRMPSSGSAKCQKPTGFSTTQGYERLTNNSHGDSASVQSEQEGGVPTAPANGNKTVEVIQWPRIYIALSRKEKEDDFLAMKGTKIPQRPKKRAKNIDRILQCCFPGMWLSELTKSRYEVREKKSVKKQKRRGLKGMENLDSDSD
ncbi:protein abrupt [Cajanus cajan]|nr:protein abrupt [Cajanus cajan]